MRVILCLIYENNPAELQTWKNYSEMPEFIRYVAGEDSVVLGRVFGLGDRRIRDIIEHERKQKQR